MMIVTEALKKSKILKLDKTEKKVKRRVAFDKLNHLEELDRKTIYVENLPKEVDNKLLFRIFSNVCLPIHHFISWMT